MRKNVLLPLAMMSVLVAALLLRPERATADPPVGTDNSVMFLDSSGKPVGDPVGSCQIVRDDNGLSFQLTTSRLTPLHPHTVWWMLFKPDNNLLLAVYASGGVALPDGTASFASRLPVGPLPAVNGKTVLAAAPGETFNDPRRVRVQILIRDHGPIILERLAEQLTIFDGACPPNTCKTVQGSVIAP